MKRLKILAFAVTAIAAFGSSAAANAATTLYPDLKTLPPRDLRFDRVDLGTGDSGQTGVHNVLRFTNTVWNTGEGPVTLQAKIDSTTKRGQAIQRIYDDAGAYATAPTGTDMYYHPSHNHYHFDRWGVFQLWTAAEYDTWIAGGSTGPEATGSKTTSCVLDEEFIRDVPFTKWPLTYPFSGCSPDSAGNMLEGLSVGWGDTYDYWRADQWIALGTNSTLADGQYVIRSVVDPDNVIRESASGADAARESRTSNDAIVRFTISGGRILDGTAPTGTALINNAAKTTTSPTVTVKALGRDDVAGVDQFRVSNDGTKWQTFTYDGQDSTPASRSWDLTNATYGGTSTPGTKTVYVQFHDRSGKWGQTETDTIEYQAPEPLSAYAKGVLADGPVSYWRLGEKSGTTANDEKGTNPGTFANGPTLGAASLLGADSANGAVSFDGTNDSMRVPYSTSMDLGSAITLEAWIKPAALPAAGQFASVVSKPESYSLQFNGPRLEFTVIQSGVRKRMQAPAGAVQAGDTYHVVGTYDGATQRLYVNGVEVASGPLSGGATKTSNGINIASWNGGNEFLRGVVDDVAVYGKTLTATQVKAHTDAGRGQQQDPPPAAPSSLTATAASDTRIDLTWKDNSTDESAFVIERSTSSSFTSPTIINAANDETFHADTGLSPSTTYWYRVRARNVIGYSSYSNVVSATTKAPPSATPPAAPSTLVAGAFSDTRIDMSWADNSNDEQSFVVERSADASFATVTSTTLPANTTSWSDTGRSPNTTYWYRVKAVNAVGSSGYSNAASATTKPPPAGYAAAVTADAPVSHWRLGETSGTAAADQRGANPGSYLGLPTLGAASLLTTDGADKAVGFDGVNDAVRIPDSNSLDLTNRITLEAWIRPNVLPAAGSFRSILTKAESYSLQFNGPLLEFTVIQNGVRRRLQAPSGTIAANVTYHVVGTFDGTTQRLYVNGAQVGSVALAGSATVTPTPLHIGSWNGTGELFRGTIDDVAVYNQALTATRVSAHWTAGRGTAPTTTTTSGSTSTTQTARTPTATSSGTTTKPRRRARRFRAAGRARVRSSRARRCKPRRAQRSAKRRCKPRRAARPSRRGR